VAAELFCISPEVTSRITTNLFELVNARVSRLLTIVPFAPTVKPDAPETFNSTDVAVVSVLLPVQTPIAA
jgi:hypothetical protein